MRVLATLQRRIRPLVGPLYIVIVCTATLSVATAVHPHNALAQSVPLTKRGVDMIKIKDGPRLLGVVSQHDEQHVTFVIERLWLKKNNSVYYKRYLEKEIESLRIGRRLQLQRLKAWREKRSEDKGLQVFLKERIAAEEKRLTLAPDVAEPDSQLIMLQFKPSDIERHFTQSAERRQVVMLAWQQRLSKVPERNVVSLQRELQKRPLAVGIDQQVNLSDRIGQSGNDDEQWAERVAIAEYRLRRQLNFQGTGNFVMQTGDEAAEADLQTVFQRMLGDEVARLTGQGLGKEKKDAWKTTATDAADKAGVTGVRVARQSQDRRTGKIQVEMSFLAKMPSGAWRVVYQKTHEQKAGKQDQAARDRIAAAPEVQRVLQIARQLGINPNDPRMQLALQFGAGTGKAHSEAQAEFEKLVQKTVDGL